MKLNGVLSYFNYMVVIVLALLFTSCKDDEGKPAKTKLDNTTWISSKDSCDSYFHFEDGEYLLLVTCHNDEDVIELVSGERGAYSADDSTLETNTEEACNSDIIGFSLAYSYTISENALTVTIGSGLPDATRVFTRADALPEIPAGAAYGYWNINNNNVWVPVEECALL